MKQITCPHCADTYPDFDVAHVCSRGPYAPKLKTRMNERILELADKAVEDMPSGPWNIPDEFCKKFAELIVKECANAIVNDSRLSDVRTARNGCVRTIKEHFGVEE